MTNASDPLTDADVHALVDDRLPPVRATAMAAALAGSPELAARVAAYRAQNDALRAEFDGWLAEPVPAALAAAATRPRSARMRSWLQWGGWAALLVLGVALGWAGRDATLARAGLPTTFAQQAAFTHALYAVDARRPVEVAASEEQGLVTWLTRRTGRTAHAPDLSTAGYRLVGGRLVGGAEKPTALLMYENADKQRLTLQWRTLPAGSGQTAFRYDVENGVGVFYWVEDTCAYAISGTIDRTHLLAIARMVYGQLVMAGAADKTAAH